MIWASVGHEVLHSNPSSHSAGVAMIVFTCFFIVGFATTWGPIVWAICGEMYPFRYRATCMGVATAANWTWNFLISFFTPFISSSIDFSYGYVFAACCFAAIWVVFFFVNETQGRTLEEVDTMYVLHVKPWKSASWVPPEGIVADLHAPVEHEPKEGGEAHQHHDEPTEIPEQQ
jgi:SP family sugar:H+ symporter-like MFS transporter